MPESGEQAQTWERPVYPAMVNPAKVYPAKVNLAKVNPDKVKLAKVNLAR